MELNPVTFTIDRPNAVVERYLLIIIISLVVIIIIGLASLIINTRTTPCSDRRLTGCTSIYGSQTFEFDEEGTNIKNANARSDISVNVEQTPHYPKTPTRSSLKLVDSVHDYRVRQHRLMRRKTEINKSLKKHNQKYMIMRPKAGCAASDESCEPESQEDSRWACAMTQQEHRHEAEQHQLMGSSELSCSQSMRAERLEDEKLENALEPSHSIVRSSLCTMQEEEEGVLCL